MDNPLPYIFQPSDLRALVIGVFGSVIAWFVCGALKRYWSYRTVRSIQKNIKLLENEKLLIENLAQSDRSVLLHSFRTLFWVIAIGCSAFSLRPVTSLLNKTSDAIDRIVLMALLSMLMISLLFFQTLKKADNRDESVETINKQWAAKKLESGILTYESVS